VLCAARWPRLSATSALMYLIWLPCVRRAGDMRRRPTASVIVTSGQCCSADGNTIIHPSRAGGWPRSRTCLRPPVPPLPASHLCSHAEARATDRVQYRIDIPGQRGDQRRRRRIRGNLLTPEWVRSTAISVAQFPFRRRPRLNRNLSECESFMAGATIPAGPTAPRESPATRAVATSSDRATCETKDSPG
jgi:hypothetical protein